MERRLTRLAVIHGTLKLLALCDKCMKSLKCQVNAAQLYPGYSLCFRS